MQEHTELHPLTPSPKEGQGLQHQLPPGWEGSACRAHRCWWSEMARHFPVGHLLWLHLHEGSVEQTAVILPARGGNVEGPRKEIHRLQRGKKEKHKETSYFTPTMLIFGQAKRSANKSSPSSTFTCTAQRQLQMAKLPLPFSTGIFFFGEASSSPSTATPEHRISHLGSFETDSLGEGRHVLRHIFIHNIQGQRLPNLLDGTPAQLGDTEKQVLV